ncbi:MAG: rRNA maturation RNase YbeY [Pseudomonadota bacterium]
MAADDIEVAVQFASDAAGIPDRATIRDWVHDAIAAHGERGTSASEVSVRIVDEPEMRRLNSDYRSKDSSTNVLSFPAEPVSGLPSDVPSSLGDVVVCAPVVAREAREQGKTVDAHWAHMLVHGTLHLLGYDHILPAEAQQMEAMELRILSQRGLENPYKLT